MSIKYFPVDIKSRVWEKAQVWHTNLEVTRLILMFPLGDGKNKYPQSWRVKKKAEHGNIS